MPQIKKFLLVVTEICLWTDTHTDTKDQLLDSPLVISTSGEQLCTNFLYSGSILFLTPHHDTWAEETHVHNMRVNIAVLLQPIHITQ